jgi:predicted metal-dependent HD superfamily phosphohydrolase
MLRESFYALATRSGFSKVDADNLWNEITLHYTAAGRHYHTLFHLQNMLSELVIIEPLFEDFDAALFALFYHDIIYDPARTDNEEQSASIATEKLRKINYKVERIDRCRELILATKGHSGSVIQEVNLFIDSDLSVLGYPWNIYVAYASNIRKEYAAFPDEVYKSGRRKVLERFLRMNTVFNTKHFIEKFEPNARANMMREIAELLR